MKYVSVAQIAKKWGVSERTVRNYCAEGKIPEAFLTGKTWNIPEDAQRPDRINKKSDEPKTAQVRKKRTIEKKSLLW